MKKLIILLALSLGVAASAFAGYAGSDEQKLPAEKGLDYKGKGNLEYKKYGTGGPFGTCSRPWNEYAISFFGYEAIDHIYLKAGGGSCCMCTDYGPHLYLYGGATESEAESEKNVLLDTYMGANNNWHDYTISDIPAEFRYIKVRFYRGGSAACGTSYFDSFKAYRTNSFSFCDVKGNKLSDPGIINLNAKEQVSYKIMLDAVKNLPSTDDVVLEMVGKSTNNPTDYIKIDNCLFNDFTSSTARSGHYNLNSKSVATVAVYFPKSGTYTVYFNVKHKDLIIQRRTVTFQVSDK